jgi:hypothetical protein
MIGAARIGAALRRRRFALNLGAWNLYAALFGAAMSSRRVAMNLGAWNSYAAKIGAAMRRRRVAMFALGATNQTSGSDALRMFCLCYSQPLPTQMHKCLCKSQALPAQMQFLWAQNQALPAQMQALPAQMQALEAQMLLPAQRRSKLVQLLAVRRQLYSVTMVAMKMQQRADGIKSTPNSQALPTHMLKTMRDACIHNMTMRKSFGASNTKPLFVSPASTWWVRIRLEELGKCWIPPFSDLIKRIGLHAGTRCSETKHTSSGSRWTRVVVVAAWRRDAYTATWFAK